MIPKNLHPNLDFRFKIQFFFDQFNFHFVLGRKLKTAFASSTKEDTVFQLQQMVAERNKMYLNMKSMVAAMKDDYLLKEEEYECSPDPARRYTGKTMIGGNAPAKP